MALWTMLGARPVDVFGWETFGNVWVTDAKVTPYRGAKGPRVSAAFPKDRNGPPGADLAPEYVGADGNTWSFIAWR